MTPRIKLQGISIEDIVFSFQPLHTAGTLGSQHSSGLPKSEYRRIDLHRRPKLLVVGCGASVFLCMFGILCDGAISPRPGRAFLVPAPGSGGGGVGSVRR